MSTPRQYPTDAEWANLYEQYKKTASDIYESYQRHAGRSSLIHTVANKSQNLWFRLHSLDEFRAKANLNETNRVLWSSLWSLMMRDFGELAMLVGRAAIEVSE